MKNFGEGGETIPEDPIIRADREDTEEDVDRIQQLLKELDLTGGVARIFRQRAGKAEFDYEGELPVDNFSLETIKRVYGGGRYQIRLTAKGGKYVKQIKFSIDPRHVGEMDRINQTQNAVTTTTPDNSNLITFLLKAQQDSQDRAQQQQAAMMTLMVTMMTESQKTTAQILAAAMQREPINVTPEPASRLMEVMMPMLIAQMQTPKSNNLADLVESLKVVKELATGQPEKEEKEEDMLDKIVKVGAPLIGAFMSRNQPMPQVPTPAPNPQQRPQIQAQPEDAQRAAAEAKMRSLLGQLRMVTPILVRAAKKDSPIESYLDILDDSLDEEGFQMLVMFLQRDDWITTLFNDDPGVRENIGWFENFRTMVLNPETDEPTEETPKDPAEKASSPFGVVLRPTGSSVDGGGN